MFEDEKSDLTFTHILFLSLFITSLFVHMGMYCAVGETLIAKVSLFLIIVNAWQH
jgi:hypothetical protein